MKLNVQHDVGAKIDLFKETCHKFLSKINDPKIVTERVKKDIIKLVIDPRSDQRNQYGKNLEQT